MTKLEQLLKEKREEKNLTLEEVANATKINLNFLKIIERGAYDELPSPAYAKGFVINYAEFLGLSKSQVIPLFKRDFDEIKAIKVLPEGMIGRTSFSLKKVKLRKFILSGLFLILIVAFFLFQARSILFSPELSIKTPKDGATVSNEVSVEGKADNRATVIINNELVKVNSNGEFKKKIILFPGQNIIKVKAVNRSGRESIINRSVIVK